MRLDSGYEIEGGGEKVDLFSLKYNELLFWKHFPDMGKTWRAYFMTAIIGNYENTHSTHKLYIESLMLQ